MCITLNAILAEQTPDVQKALLSHKTEDAGQLTTPLIIAAWNGHDRTVQTLLSQFHPDLSQSGSVKLGDFVIEEASALWCAAGAGHLKIVKMLVNAKADVNQS